MSRRMVAVDASADSGVVEVRLIGADGPVRRLVEALTAAAGPAGSSRVSYRASRHTPGAVRAYVDVVVPPGHAGEDERPV
ncbi:hypothetical protein [Streptomyces albogriseolus]|uniref:hypothetical protein n=1 Tax=Streptomyces albogriseolus TaxID=1887 RepID=UPI003460C35D